MKTIDTGEWVVGTGIHPRRPPTGHIHRRYQVLGSGNWVLGLGEGTGEWGVRHGDWVLVFTPDALIPDTSIAAIRYWGAGVCTEDYWEKDTG